jgi:hypothetical protein
MTKNRARIRAAKTLAASSDIRHPDASYLADHRKLRLPDGTIHDFAQGPLRLSENDIGTARAQAGFIRGRAEEKRWVIAHVSTDNLSLLDLIPERPCLAFIVGAGTPASTQAAELVSGAHLDLNIVIIDESYDPIYLKAFPSSEPGAAPVLITGRAGSGRNADLLARAKAANTARESLAALGVPQAAQEFASHASGLFLVTGTTGQGKTSTGAALLRRAHCDTGLSAAAIMLSSEMVLADYPGVKIYEADYEDDTAPRIRAAVADGAKIIFVEGLYDAESIEAALDAALGGALVFATMHTQASGAAQRLLDAFPNSGNVKIRAKVQLALRGVLEQVLVRKAGDQPGRVLASEVWLESDDVLSPAITLKESLDGLVEEGTIDPQSAEKAMLHRW